MSVSDKIQYLLPYKQNYNMNRINTIERDVKQQKNMNNGILEHEIVQQQQYQNPSGERTEST